MARVDRVEWLSMPDPKFYLNIVDSLSPVIVPREAVEAPGGLAENPIGTGAFMLKEFSPGDGALLVKNPDYYLKDKQCPLAYEPSGEDFLSPCLAEADVVRRVLRPARWADRCAKTSCSCSAITRASARHGD